MSAIENKTLAILGGTVAIVVFLFGLVAYNNSISNSNLNAQEQGTESYQTMKAKIEAVPISEADCDAISQLIDNEPFALNAEKRLSKAKKAANRLTKWNAEKYLKNNTWVRSSLFPEEEMPYGKFVRELSDLILKRVVATLDSSSQESFTRNSKESWYDNYATFAVSNCGLREELEENRKLVWEFDKANSTIIILAQQKPWYPKGFLEISGFPGFAYKASNRGCSYSFGGTCATFEIVSQVACSSNLYVQTNLLSGDTVVDWSNDTATVRAGQIAYMETTFTSSYGDTWEFAEISCY